MAEKELYSKHLDSIIALVSHLALTHYKSRTPSSLANYLSLEEDEVLVVLENFKGLFRKSLKPSKKKPGEYLYTLQLRYALRWLESGVKPAGNSSEDDDDNEEAQSAPLSGEYLSTLLSFISEMVANEQAEKRQKSANRSATIGAWIAAGAAVIAAIAAIIAALVS